MVNAYQRVIEALAQLNRVNQSGPNRATTRCPAHEDRYPSLSIKRGKDRALIHCFAGCDYRDILAALDLTPGDLFDDPRSAPYKPNPAEEARYTRRKTLTQLEKAIDDLLQLPDLGERLALGSARIRPELYIMEREGL